MLRSLIVLVCLVAACSSSGGEGAVCTENFDCELPLVCRSGTCGPTTSEVRDGGSEDVDPVDPNNRAVLTGAAFGSDSEALATLAAPVELDIKATPSDLRVGTATKARSDASTGYYQLIVPVENVGRRAHCFVRASFRVLNAAGALLDEDMTFVQGSVGNGSAGYTDTCLWPEEKGWVLASSDGAAWDAIAKVEVSLSASEGGPYSRPEPRLLPTSYRVEDEQDQIVVTVENPGPGTVAFDSARIVYLGSDGAPLGYSFESISPEPLIEAGQSLEIHEDMRWKGRATKVDVLLDFERR